RPDVPRTRRPASGRPDRLAGGTDGRPATRNGSAAAVGAACSRLSATCRCLSPLLLRLSHRLPLRAIRRRGLVRLPPRHRGRCARGLGRPPALTAGTAWRLCPPATSPPGERRSGRRFPDLAQSLGRLPGLQWDDDRRLLFPCSPSCPLSCAAPSPWRCS